MKRHHRADIDYDTILDYHRDTSTPEEDLWYMVLCDAVDILRGIIVQPDPTCVGLKWSHGRTDVLAAFIKREREWFLSESTEPQSFLWICTYLSLDAEYILSGLAIQGLLSGGIVIPTVRRRRKMSLIERTGMEQKRRYHRKKEHQERCSVNAWGQMRPGGGSARGRYYRKAEGE